MKQSTGRLKRGLKAKFPRAWTILHTTRKNLREFSYWNHRISEVLQCPDNARIPRVADAGRIKAGIQLMHNGLSVCAGSYYGWGGKRLLKTNRGCHEPQEEFAFMQVLKCLGPKAVIVECGAYWAFYSMWFCKEVSGGAAYLIEPEQENLRFGRRNFDLNGLTGTFYQAFIGAGNSTRANGAELIGLDTFARIQGIQRLGILHADIQGSELQMLRGASDLLARRAVSFLFISTHSEELHLSCRKFLLAAGYDPFVSILPRESFSVDGVLVARSEEYRNMLFEQPSKKAGACPTLQGQ